MLNELNFLLLLVIFLEFLKETSSYDDTVVFNWTQTPSICYFEDFNMTDNYRPYVDEQWPVRGCRSDDRNKNAKIDKRALHTTLINITFEPRLDYFFNKDEYPPINRDPPNAMTFVIVNDGATFILYYMKNIYTQHIYFGRSEDYHPIPKISKWTGKPIQYIGNKAILAARCKLVETQLIGNQKYDYSYSDYELYDDEGVDFNVTFDGFDLNFTGYLDVMTTIPRFVARKDYSLVIKIYDLPRMKVQGWFQYKYSVRKVETGEIMTKQDSIYTVDTRNIFFQNISMFYNQKVNVTDDGLEPTGEDSGFWVKTPCNTIQMATIMVDYHFFDTIHRMQSYGYEFGDRFQLRIHTPYYRKTLNSEYSLFRSQWNKTYPQPRVFIHPIYKYKEYCDTYKNCTKFNYDEWSTDPKFTKYIIDIKNEIRGNQIWINFTELEKIYEADGFHRGKLVINVNNTMTPHITQHTNGLWAELVDLVTNDWVMKTKTIMDEVNGYIDDYEADPYRNFYLTCEIPDNLTSDDIEFVLKKVGMLQTSSMWFRLDVFNKGITKMYPQRFNAVFKFPPEIHVTNETYMYTYQYFLRFDYSNNNYYVLKDLRETGIGDGTITNATFDYKRNMVNVSELHPNYPNGDDTMFYSQFHMYVCFYHYVGNDTCANITIHRFFLYYFYDLQLMFTANDTGPIDITIYQIKYVPYHSKNQINRGLHRWNQHHAGWDFSRGATIELLEEIIGQAKVYRLTFRHYYEAWVDNFFLRDPETGNYYNQRGSSMIDDGHGIKGYSGSDCVFSFAGGSTLRNTSCEYWVGIIPDKPFTNYARDIVEEFVAYRTLNDGTFNLNTSITAEGFQGQVHLTCPYPGHYTVITFFVGYMNHTLEREYEDNEPTCLKQFIKTPDCIFYIERYEKLNPHKSIHNVHRYSEDFFIKVELPTFMSIREEYIGQILPCFRPIFENYYTMYRRKPNHICYIANSKTAYAFNDERQLGTINQFDDYDVYFLLDYLYIHEEANFTKFPKLAGVVKYGFFDTPIFYSPFPDSFFPDFSRYLNNATAIMTMKRNSTVNDEMVSFNISLLFTKEYVRDLIVRLYFGKGITYMKFIDQTQNGVSPNPTVAHDAYLFGFRRFLIKVGCDTCSWTRFDRFSNITQPEDTNPNLVFACAVDPKQVLYDYQGNILKNGETMTVDIYFEMLNPRSLKTQNIYYFLEDNNFLCAHQRLIQNITNTEPQTLINVTITPNSYFTSDRAIYEFRCYTGMRELLVGDVFEFKSSWKTKFYNNTEAPDDKGYYINKFIVKEIVNITKNNKTMIYKVNFLLNPETTETQYIKDIIVHDEEGYLVSVCNETIPIQMKKIIGFKRSDVYTEKTAEDNKFDITYDVVPDVLIKKDDKFIMKFSSAVLLQNYSECIINSTLGLSTSDKDFRCEIDADNNEIILINAFKEIGESISIFEEMNSISLSKQQFTFSLKNIPINSTNNDYETIFSTEIKTESEGKITQTNLLPSTAIFKCDSRCKTCNEGAPSECLTCIDDFPIYYPQEKYCRKFCPKEKYYERLNEDGTLECLKCEEPCENCLGNATNCTFCSEGYFMENNTCVENCGEEKGKDFILRVCYPLTKMNKTVYVDRTIYVNVSVPDYYPVYIHRNICLIGDQ